MTNNALGRFAPDLEDRCVTKADTFFTRMAAASIASQGASLGWLKVKLVAAAVESAMIERVLRHLGLLWQAYAPRGLRVRPARTRDEHRPQAASSAVRPMPSGDSGDRGGRGRLDRHSSQPAMPPLRRFQAMPLMNAAW